MKQIFCYPMSLSGKVVAITGKLFSPRDKITELITKNGGIFSSTVTKKVTHLVTTNPSASSSKLQKARNLGIQIVDESFLRKLVKRSAKDLHADEPQTKKQKNLPSKDVVMTDASSTKSLEGMIIAMTGALLLPRKHYEQLIKSNGGTFAKTVTKKVTHLVAANPDAASAKLSKARANGTKIVGESFFTGLSLSTPTDTSLQNASENPKPLHEMKEGDIHKIQGNSGEYEIRLSGGNYYCTCPAWRNQNLPVDKRTCKHMRQYLGDEFETWRTQMKLPKVILPKQNEPEILLANKYDESKHDPTDWWMSEKFDGVRAFWDGTNFISRLGNVYYAPDWFKKDLPKDTHLDGELYMGRGKFQETISIVKSFDAGERWKKLKYMVFDVPTLENEPFEKRMAFLQSKCTNWQYTKYVVQTKCKGKDFLNKKLEEIDLLGGEGWMLRKPKSKYVRKRSNILLKVKSWIHDEAVVVGFGSRGKGRLAGMAGSLQVRNTAGKTFNVGSGLSDAQRKNPPQPGTMITYKYQELTNGGKPRFPIFVGIAIDKKPF